MRASAELYNLLEYSKYDHWAPDRKHHKEATLGFDYYKTVFVVDGKVFEGLINIANSENGRVFYDITEIKEVSDLRGKYVALLARSSSTFGNPENSVTQADMDVKTENADFPEYTTAVEMMPEGFDEYGGNSFDAVRKEKYSIKRPRMSGEQTAAEKALADSDWAVIEAYGRKNQPDALAEQARETGEVNAGAGVPGEGTPALIISNHRALCTYPSGSRENTAD